MRIAVIGAGAAGLAAARHVVGVGGVGVGVCVSAPGKHTCTVFEQSDQVGGTWVYTEKTGNDDYGYPLHTSMYKSLRTNLPKEVMGYPDFPVQEDEKSYLPAKGILNFLNSYADHFDIRQHIKFHQHVKSVNPNGNVWDVTVVDVRTKKEEKYVFDAVMVCNGHYSTPYIAALPGAERFRGEQLHCHDYRIPQRFQGKRVVVIGAGPSGMDLTLELASTATQVIMSHHLKDEIKTIFPKHVLQKPDVKTITETSVTFEDGSTFEVDVIFYCTGYKYSFPFLTEKCKVLVEDNYVQPLYKHMIHIEYPTLCFIGLPFYVCAFSMFDLQVRFFLKTLDGVKLPARDEMRQETEREMDSRKAAGLSYKQAHMMGPMQGDYYADLAKVAGITPLPPVLTKLHNDSSQRFLDDLVHYREDVYKIVDDNTFVQVK